MATLRIQNRNLSEQRNMAVAIVYFAFLVHFSHCLHIQPSKHLYDNNANTYFEYNPYDYENCTPAADCDFVRNIIHQEAIEDCMFVL